MKPNRRKLLFVWVICVILGVMECRPANHLKNEKSPYLLQHAHNPVDWYPWGDEAFAKARLEKKLIFLSIGYSTCHWCHVMERESFENEEIARLLNRSFVSIKVDREERPDIDQEYMQVCQLLSANCGWPLTIIMTPEREPFFAATYLPPVDRRRMRGLASILPEIERVYEARPDKIRGLISEIRQALRNEKGPLEQGAASEELFLRAFLEFERRYDPHNGGFGRAPKFPSPHNLSFLLHYAVHLQNPLRTSPVKKPKHQVQRSALMALDTLQKIRLSGTYDQLGFGFHRYATDPAWRVPHFEKMLYDQALLILACTDGVRYLRKQLFSGHKEGSTKISQSKARLQLLERTIAETILYLKRDLRDSNGAFFTAEDADSEGEEGIYYLWSYDEVEALPDGPFLVRALGLRKQGVSHELGTRNTLTWPTDWGGLAREFGITEEEARKRLEKGRALLYEMRSRRKRPFRDTKILTDLNGLVVAALARAGWVMDRPEWVDLARSAADFVLEKMQRSEEGRAEKLLFHRYYEGEAGVDGLLDDYSFLVFGLLELYQADAPHHASATFYLSEALRLTQIMCERFWDSKEGGFFHSAVTESPAFVRTKPIYDGAIPSGNSVAFDNLMRLSRLTSNPDWERKADEFLTAFGRELSSHPSAFAQSLQALLFEADGLEIVVASPREGQGAAGDQRDAEEQRMLDLIRNESNAFVLYASPALSAILPFTKEQGPREGKTTVYVCRNRVCRYPVTDAQSLSGLFIQP